MRAKRTASLLHTHRVLLVLALAVSMTACNADDSEGGPWSVDDPPDAGDRADASAPDVPGVGEDTPRDSDLPGQFVGCLDETDLHPAEVKLQGSPRIEEGLDLNWSYPLPLPGEFGATEDVERVGAPSLLADSQNRFNPVATFTSESNDGERFSVQNWGVDTFTGASVGGGASSSSAMRFRSIAPDPVIGATRSSAQILGEYSDFRERLGIEVAWSTARTSSSTGMPVDAPNPTRTIGRFAMLPQGLLTLHWGETFVLGLNPNFFQRRDEGLPPRLRFWAAGSDYLWGNGESSAVVEWIAGPRPDEAVVLLDAGEGDTKWVRIDRCGRVSDVYEAPNLTRDILWTGEGYLVMLDDAELPGGARPVHVGDDGEVRAARFGCRNPVERRENQWACLRQSQTGFSAVTFGLDMQRIEEQPLPGSGWSTARLDLAGDGGALVFTGTVAAEDGSQFQVGVLGDDIRETIRIEPEPGDEAAPRVMRDRIGVLGPSGVFVFTTAHAVYGVETPIAGLANTRHPRALYAGNESRGYVSVE